MTATATCTRCGDTFTVPEHLRTRFPGWTPQRCRSCHTSGGTTTAATADGTGAAAASGGAGAAATSGARRRNGRTGRSGSARRPTSTSAPLSPEQVLATYTAGPTSGVFTDGSADPNPGPGGWGAVYVRDDEIVDQAHGHEADTTNNRMELTALIAGYDLVPPGESAVVYSDSNYCVRMINEWADGWARNNWRRRTGPVKNLDLVKQLYERARARPELTLRWIKAHDGSRWNEYADALSVAYRRT